MREWDEMIARQVAADGVRTTWGEHMPAEPVTTDDSTILSDAAFNKEWEAIEASGWSWVINRAPRLRAHDRALRALLDEALTALIDASEWVDNWPDLRARIGKVVGR